MRSERLYTGIVLVLIGMAFLLDNLGYIDFHWINLLRLWPVFLVIAGINMLLSGTNAVWATVIRVIVLVSALGFVVLGNPGGSYHKPFIAFDFSDDKNGRNDDSDVNTSNKEGNKATFRQAYTPDVKYARLNIYGGATSYKLSETTPELFNASTKEFNNHFNLQYSKEDSVQVLNFDMNRHGQRFSWSSSEHGNLAVMQLNTAPQWEINVKGGAASVDFDLTPFNVRSLSFNGGAASYKVKLGTSAPVTKVQVSAGMSDIGISIPKEAACDVVISSGLSSSSFDGFTKISKKHFTVGDFNTAKNKIYINLKGGLAEFKVNRY